MGGDTYLPELATTKEACTWLESETGMGWAEKRLYMSCTPYVWLDYVKELDSLFKGRLEGYPTPLVFWGDQKGLLRPGGEVALTVILDPEGETVKFDQPLYFPQSELLWREEDVRRLAEKASEDETSNPLKAGKSKKPEIAAQSSYPASEVASIDWGLASCQGAPESMGNILRDKPKWLEDMGVYTQPGAPGKKGNDGAWIDVVKLAKALALRTGRKGWWIPVATLERIIDSHFPRASAEWSAVKDYLENEQKGYPKTRPK